MEHCHDHAPPPPRVPQGENNNYRKWPAEFNYSLDAVKGHMPLTNALRGTQLMVAIFDHPAMERAGSGAGGKKLSLDEKSAELAKGTLKFF